MTSNLFEKRQKIGRRREFKIFVEKGRNLCWGENRSQMLVGESLKCVIATSLQAALVSNYTSLALA